MTTLFWCTITTALLMACSTKGDDDNSEVADNSNSNNTTEQTSGEQRALFQEYMGNGLKMLAENMNLAPWQAANLVNRNFNSNLLDKTDFKDLFLQNLQQALKPTLQPANEQLQAHGFKYQGTIDLITVLEWFTQQSEDPIVNFTTAGELTPVLASYLSSDTLAVIMQVPRQLLFSINSNAIRGETAELFNGILQLSFTANSLIANPLIDTWTIKGKVESSVPTSKDKDDAATLNFTVAQDGANKKSTLKMAFEHNGKTMLEIDANNTQENGIANIPEFPEDTSLLELIYSFASGKKIDNMKLTLLSDMTITLSISDCAAAVSIWQEAKTARRGYAPVTTIDIFTEQLNQLITASVSCKKINQQLPVKLVTARIGADHLAMPALKFADEDYYAPITELLDMNTMGYAINIVDHCLDPAQETVITIRQFMQLMKTLLNTEKQEKP